jgi:hypothetical protein
LVVKPGVGVTKVESGDNCDAASEDGSTEPQWLEADSNCGDLEEWELQALKEQQELIALESRLVWQHEQQLLLLREQVQEVICCP